MWLVAMVITATVSGESQVANSSSYLDAAITGFDPFYMTALTQPNPGRRSKLFQTLTTLLYKNKTVLESFVNEEQDNKYLPQITVQKVINFNEYLDFTASAVYELSSNADCVKPIHRNANNSSCTTTNRQQDSAMLQFFKDTGGEVLLAKTDAVTHTITISSFVITTFTPAFEKAVEALYKEAVNPFPEMMKSTFNEFVRLYGTHFSRRTLLGSRAIFGKLFSTRAATVEEETFRRRCVRAAAREALTPCMRGYNETTQTVFTKASARCGREEHEPVVAVTGPLPESTLEDWASAAKDCPNPLFHELEPLSTLFTSAWFEDYFDGIQLRINGTRLSQYFDDSVSDYSRRMVIGGPNSVHFRGCGLSSDCQKGTECRDEPGTESGFSCTPREDAETASKTISTNSITTTRAPRTTTTTTMRPTTTTIKQCADGGGLLQALWGSPLTLTSHPGYGSSNHDDNILFSCRLHAMSGRVRVRLLSFNTIAYYPYVLNRDERGYLAIYDGNSTSYPLLAALSGSPAVATYTSSGLDMLLRFGASPGTSRPGFSLTYEVVV